MPYRKYTLSIREAYGKNFKRQLRLVPEFWWVSWPELSHFGKVLLFTQSLTTFVNLLNYQTIPLSYVFAPVPPTFRIPGMKIENFVEISVNMCLFGMWRFHVCAAMGSKWIILKWFHGISWPENLSTDCTVWTEGQGEGQAWERTRLVFSQKLEQIIYLAARTRRGREEEASRKGLQQAEKQELW